MGIQLQIDISQQTDKKSKEDCKNKINQGFISLSKLIQRSAV